MNTKELETAVIDLQNRVKTLEETISTFKPRDRGPDSTREMTDEDARRVKFGDLKSATHKSAAKTLGLSYGQVYSCREGYTFKHVKEIAQAS